MNQKAIDILKKYAVTKRHEFKNQSFNNKIEHDFSAHARIDELKNLGPMTKDEAFKNRSFIFKGRSAAEIIDPRLYNKKFSVGDFEIHVAHVEKQRVEDSRSSERGMKFVYHNLETKIEVYVSYHGSFNVLMWSNDYCRTTAALCTPEQTNWGWLKPTKEKPYIMDEISFHSDYNKIDFIDELFRSIDVNSLVLSNVNKITNQDVDLEWFVKSEIKDGVYRPESYTIANWIYTNTSKIDKKLLSKLGVHTIQLRADAHFDPTYYYDLKGIKIKAPQAVIEKYDLQKYCKDDSIVKKIKEKQY